MVWVFGFDVIEDLWPDPAETHDGDAARSSRRL